MKKAILIFLLSALTVFSASCSSGSETKNISNAKTVNDVLNQQTETTANTTEKATAPAENQSKNKSDKKQVDVDLTKLSSTMVYTKVYHMMYEPKEFIGKTVRMNGTMAVSESKGKSYYACLIKDATACCSQGIEFVLDKGDYPKEGEDITVYGTFNTYKEGVYQYCQLKNAVLE